RTRPLERSGGRAEVALAIERVPEREPELGAIAAAGLLALGGGEGGTIAGDRLLVAAGEQRLFGGPRARAYLRGRGRAGLFGYGSERDGAVGDGRLIDGARRPLRRGEVERRTLARAAVERSQACVEHGQWRYLAIERRGREIRGLGF